MRWGRKTLPFFDTQPLARGQELDQERLEAHGGWICGFRAQLHEGGELLQMIEVTESLVRTPGLYRGVPRDLQDLLAPLACAPRTPTGQHHLLAVVAEHSCQATPHERVLGSREVLESGFGTLQRLEQDQANRGSTGRVLGRGAGVSPTTPAVGPQALATVTTQDVLDGRNHTRGPSVQAQRRAAFTVPDKPEQTWDQFEEAL
jgi:hypothetical protein